MTAVLCVGFLLVGIGLGRLLRVADIAGHVAQGRADLEQTVAELLAEAASLRAECAAWRARFPEALYKPRDPFFGE